MQTQIVEAKPYHLGRILRRLRDEHRAGLIATGVNAHRELRDMFAASSFRYAWLVDGQLAAVGGVTGSMLSSAGQVWLAVAEDATRFPLAMVKEARRQLARILASKTELTTTILCGDKTSRRFAAFLGFRDKALPYLPPGNSGMALETDQFLGPCESAGTSPFIVFGLPRSRTKWLSRFLSYGAWRSHHDLPVSVGSLDHLLAELGQPHVGSTETGLAVAWRSIRERFPEARFAVVRRSVAEVETSARRFGWEFPPGYLHAQNARLDEIAAQPGTLSVDFADLANEGACRAMFEHCLRQPFERAWWKKFEHQNIQIDMHARRRELGLRLADMSNLFREIGETVTLQTEAFSNFYRDGQALFAAHEQEAVTAGEEPIDPNVEMAQALEASGRLLIVTARNATEMVGYLVFVVGPILERRGVLCGFQNIFFVRKDMRGIMGRRLHARARAELKARNVDMLVMRAGVRASGPKQNHLFQRLGARPMGSVYSLNLGA